MDNVRTLVDSRKFWLQAAFIVSLSAALGSLLLEYGFGLLPCELCWWQRIFMYPLPFIFGAALAQKRTDVFWYTFPLIIVGAAVAVFHYTLQLWPSTTNVCGGSFVSCVERQIDIFGFLTIPLGSLLTFAAVGFCLMMLRRAKS